MSCRFFGNSRAAEDCRAHKMSQSPRLPNKYSASDATIDTALRRLFTSYTDAGSGSTLSSSKFSKLWKEAGLVGGGNKSLTSVDLDLAFVRAANASAPAKPTLDAKRPLAPAAPEPAVALRRVGLRCRTRHVV